MLGPLQSLKSLETLVKQVTEALHRATAENKSLKDKLQRLEAEHKRLKEEFRESKMALSRHERLKSRLIKLSEKLEKIG